MACLAQGGFGTQTDPANDQCVFKDDIVSFASGELDQVYGLRFWNNYWTKKPAALRTRLACLHACIQTAIT